jgi:hypothetical protein
MNFTADRGNSQHKHRLRAEGKKMTYQAQSRKNRRAAVQRLKIAMRRGENQSLMPDAVNNYTVPIGALIGFQIALVHGGMEIEVESSTWVISTPVFTDGIQQLDRVNYTEFPANMGIAIDGGTIDLGWFINGCAQITITGIAGGGPFEAQASVTVIAPTLDQIPDSVSGKEAYFSIFPTNKEPYITSDPLSQTSDLEYQIEIMAVFSMPDGFAGTCGLVQLVQSSTERTPVGRQPQILGDPQQIALDINTEVKDPPTIFYNGATASIKSGDKLIDVTLGDKPGVTLVTEVCINNPDNTVLISSYTASDNFWTYAAYQAAPDSSPAIIDTLVVIFAGAYVKWGWRATANIDPNTGTITLQNVGADSQIIDETPTANWMLPIWSGKTYDQVKAEDWQPLTT